MYTLTTTKATYSRTDSDLSWRAQPDEVETETAPWDEDRHRKMTGNDTLQWFRRMGGSEYAERSYTPVGYIVTRLVSANPGRTVRVVRKFTVSED